MEVSHCFVQLFLSRAIKAKKQHAKLIFSCCFSYLILLFRWQRWHSSYEPKQQFFLFNVVGSSNNKIKIWQRSNKRSFYAQKTPCSWYRSYCHVTRTHWQTITYSEWIEIAYYVMKCFLYFCTLYITQIFYWFLFTSFNINLKKTFYLCYTKISLHTASITHAQKCFARKREKKESSSSDVLFFNHSNTLQFFWQQK